MLTSPRLGAGQLTQATNNVVTNVDPKQKQNIKVIICYLKNMWKNIVQVGFPNVNKSQQHIVKCAFSILFEDVLKYTPENQTKT